MPTELETYLTERQKDVDFIAVPSSDEKTGRVQDNTEYALAHTHVPTLVEMLRRCQEHLIAYRPGYTRGPDKTLCELDLDDLARAAMEEKSSIPIKK